MPPYQALIFDLDGTLIDSAPSIAAAINRYFADRGWTPLETDFVETFIGNGPRRLIEDILRARDLPASEADIDAALAAYLDNYAADPASQTRFFPHVPEDLRMLRAAGFRLGICTNKTQSLTEKILEMLDLAPLIDAAVGADAVPACKPDPGHLLAVSRRMNLAPDCWAYVGDTAVDLAAASAAEVPFYVVPWGGGAQVTATPAQRLSRLADLATLTASASTAPREARP